MAVKTANPTDVPARDELTTAQFNQMMATGLKQAREDDSFDVDEVFEELERGIDNV